MQELNLRLGQAVALTYAQTDENFKRLKTAIDALEVAVAGAGLGSVTSVGLTLPNIFTVTNSPVTTTGSLTATLASQSANSFFASPDGSAGTPTFRSLLAADLPTVPIANGGTDLTSPIPNNFVLSSNGSAYQGREILPTGGLTAVFAPASITLGLNPALINITGFAGTLTSTKGGTGLTGPFANNQILIGNGSSSWTSAVLTAGSGINISNAPGLITISNTATGVSQLNYLTGNILMAFGSSGNSPAINENNITSEITFNIPNAGPSPVTRGLLTAADWTTFNNKVSSTGTTSYIPKFTASNNIGNSRMFDTGTKIGVNTTTPFWDLDVHSVAPGTPSVIRAFGISALASVRAESSGGAGLGFISMNSDGNISSDKNIRINNVTKGALFYTTGNTQINAGFAISGFFYWNVAGNYTFATNEQYGVILGTGSDATMSIALPTAPMDGQEVCVLCEEDKTSLSFTSAKVIRGHNGGTGISVTITGGAAKGSAILLAKYAEAANNGLGAWFVSVSE